MLESMEMNCEAIKSSIKTKVIGIYVWREIYSMLKELKVIFNEYYNRQGKRKEQYI